VLGGQTVTEIDKDGEKRQTIVYAFGRPLAEQRIIHYTYPVSTGEYVAWEIRDPSNTSVRGIGKVELDPEGTTVGLTNPYEEEEPELVGNINYFNPYLGGGASGTGNWGCRMDGINVPCSAALGLLHSGGGRIVSANFGSLDRLGIVVGQRWIEKKVDNGPCAPGAEYCVDTYGHWENVYYFFDGNSGNSDIPTVVEFKKRVQEKFGQRFTDCFNAEMARWLGLKPSSAFGSLAAKIQTINSWKDSTGVIDLTTLNVDARYTSSQISKKLGMNDPRVNAGPDGASKTVFIAKEHWNNEISQNEATMLGKEPSQNRSIVENAFIHDAGNVLSWIHADHDYRAFGRGKRFRSDEKDYDSGYQIQKCVFGN
jgi:hypothetical protein